MSSRSWAKFLMSWRGLFMFFPDRPPKFVPSGGQIWGARWKGGISWGTNDALEFQGEVETGDVHAFPEVKAMGGVPLHPRIQMELLALVGPGLGQQPFHEAAAV